MLNLHRLLYREFDPVSFHAELLPTDQQRKTLTDAKNTIRDHLRATIAEASVKILKMPKRIEPRFRNQGSWSYRTCIRPAHLPPQEMDWDFGVYLPATFWRGTPPPFAAKAYFDLVESSLVQLCRQQGWELVSGTERKDRCIRIRIARWAHIDISLYAVPEAQFTQINEVAFAENARRRKALAEDDAQYLAMNAERGELADFAWELLEDIMLATRTGEWQPSDPFAVTRWFADCVAEHGDQLRRLCRYLKAWRDYHWPNGGGPSSIVLMICAVESFERRFHRDDIALQDAAERMSRMLRDGIYVDAIDAGKEDFNRLSDPERREAADRAASLRSVLQTARSYGPSLKAAALQNLRVVLGPRLPSDADLIEIEAEADRIRATPAVAVAAPVVRTTRSG